MEGNDPYEETFRVCITIREAKNLTWVNMNPVVCVEVGSEVKYTSVRKNTDRPFYNEYFVFEFGVPFDELLEQRISISVLHVGGLFHKKKLFANIYFDVATIWLQKGHHISRKWLPLMDPNDITGPPKGYLKCDITILSKELPAVFYPEESDESDIEGNLLIPDCTLRGRRRALYSFHVFQAENLPRPRPVFKDNVRKALGKEKEAPHDVYVKIIFGDMKGTTSEKTYSTAIWNEEISFLDIYPPLFQRVKIQICYSGGVWTGFFIDLKSLSNDEPEGFLPTFGPAYSQLYGLHKSVLPTKKEGMRGDCAQYRGRLLWALVTHLHIIQPYDLLTQRTVLTKPTNYLQKKHWNTEDIFLIGVIFGGTVSDAKLRKKELMIELTMGTEFTSLDDAHTNLSWPFEGNRDKSTSEEHCQVWHFNFQGKYPCVYYKYKFPIVEQRLYQTNILFWMATKLKWDTWTLKESTEKSSELIRSIFRILAERCRKCLDHFNSWKKKDATSVTTLDSELLRMCCLEVESILQSAEKWSQTATSESFEDALHQLKSYSRKFEVIAENPQDMLPHLHIWVWRDKLRYAFERIAARRLIYSQHASERGDLCGKIRTYCLKMPWQPGKQRNSDCVASVQLFMCIGKREHYSKMVSMLPPGWDANCLKENHDTLKNCILYTNFMRYNVVVYLYQARIFVGRDTTGLCDPFVRITMWEKCVTSTVKFATLNPLWNETLRLINVELPGNSDYYYKLQPPCLMLELLDMDKEDRPDVVGTLSFVVNFVPEQLNRETLRPSTIRESLVSNVPTYDLLQMARDEKGSKTNMPSKERSVLPSFHWYPVFYVPNEHTGDILASFFISQTLMGDSGDQDQHGVDQEQNDVDHIKIPRHVSLEMKSYRLEAYFWGLRNFKTTGCHPIHKPHVVIECSGYELRSSDIHSFRSNVNFSSPLQYMDLKLPALSEYQPAITIKILDDKLLKRHYFLGCHIIHDVNKFKRNIDGLQIEEHKTQTGDATEMVENSPGHSPRESLIVPPGVIAPNIRQTTQMKWTKFYDAFVNDVTLTKKNVLSERLRRHSRTEEDVDDTERDWWTKYYNAIQTGENNLDDRQQKRGDSVKTPTLRIYNQELEKQPEFQNFMDWLLTFPIRRGHWKEFEDSHSVNTVGMLKCSLTITDLPEEKQELLDINKHRAFNYPSNKEENIIVRVYVIRAIGLHPMDYDGKSDPYITVQVGRKKIQDKDNYVNNELNPVFGRCYEFEAKFPHDYLLKVRIMDLDTASANDLIGETVIDLENRFYSMHRGSCGIASHYDDFGYNQWRDNQQPSDILQDMCSKYQIKRHYYKDNYLVVGSRTFKIDVGPENMNTYSREVLALNALHNWADIPEAGLQLVPEHVETRSLYHRDMPGIERGKLQMWVDIFSPRNCLPPAIDVSPRKSRHYELRCIIWNTEEVLLSEDDFFTGEKISDIYIKGWLIGINEIQTTDVHYRSLTGEGMFNWRFIFPFDYLSAEGKIVLSKSVMFSDKKEYHFVPCRLCLQIWDNDHFSADDFLGMMILDIARLPKGAKESSQCNLRMLKADAPTINLFKIKRTKGWWPFQDVVESSPVLVGKLEMELELLTEEEAEIKPAGKGRSEPDALPKPQRPDTSFSFFRTPFRALRYLICHRYKWRCILFLILVLIFLVITAGIYAAPGYVVKKLLGA